MNNTNTLISGDNKGYASYLMEKSMNKGALPGQVRGLYLHCMLVLMLVMNNIFYDTAKPLVECESRSNDFGINDHYLLTC